MSRRDTIIIAVLVNAGLLLVLFATAMRSGDKKKDTSTELVDASINQKDPQAPLSTEDLLNEYIAAGPQNSNEEVIFTEELSSLPSTPPELSLEAAIAANSASQSPSLSGPIAATPTPILSPTSSQATSSETDKVVDVTVKKGDYLEKIAKANNSSVAAIMKSNNMSSTQLKIGQVLHIPVKGSVKEEKKETPQSSPINDFYVVKEGDSPWLIASKCHVKLEELLRLNNIDEQKAKRLRPGDKLRIR